MKEMMRSRGGKGQVIGRRKKEMMRVGVRLEVGVEVRVERARLRKRMKKRGWNSWVTHLNWGFGRVWND